ncbi:uncharacterized protein LOC34621660 [Cyclospora cayetanensis]|uniref:Exportin-T n=1 Tax=Cyclospora cayetanensis TaxID=88456 RepID=A0A6P6RSX7_9EIME|nr:uncharacterized protein LOC34621660 [Cyclospora cayetanensis]
MQVEEFERAVSTLFAHGNAPVSPENRCEAEQYLTGERGCCDRGLSEASVVWCVALATDGVLSCVCVCVAALCGSSSGSVLLLSALRARCSLETKFFALQQLLQLLPQQQQQQRQQMQEMLFNVMRLRVCSDSLWACSNSCGGGRPRGVAAAFAAAATDAASSPDAAAVHNKLALVVARLLAADVGGAAPAAAAVAAAKGTKAAFMPLRQLLHQGISALCLHLREAGEETAEALAAAAAIAERCMACSSASCASEAVHSAAAILESLRVALRVLLVLHQEYLEDAPASPLSAALKNSFPYDENVNPNATTATCPPPFSPMLLQLLRLLQLLHKHSPALGSVLQLCCSVVERYVGWIDLLLPEQIAVAEVRDHRGDHSSSTPNLLQLLGDTWLASGYPEAASAIVVFIHRKMEPAARIDLLCRMKLVEWLLHCIPHAEIAASPTMLTPFASMVNTAVAALAEASAALAEKLETAGECDSWVSDRGNYSPPATDRSRRELLQRGMAAMWSLVPLSLQLLGSGGLEVSSTVIASLSLLLSKSSLLRRHEAMLLQPLPSSRFESLLLELLQVLLKRLAEVDALMGAAQQQQMLQEQQQQVVYSSLDDEEIEQLAAYKEALTVLFRRSCVADQTRVLVWIQEGLQQQMQQYQQQQSLQQRHSHQQEFSALLHMLLVLTDDIHDLPEKLKDTSNQLHTCLLQLLQLLHSLHEAAPLFSAAAAENFMRILVRVAPLFIKQQQHIPEALSLLAGQHGVCSSSYNIAPKACLALLRFVKNCLPYSAAYTGLLVQHLLQQQCLDIPSCSSSATTQHRQRPATPPSCNNSSRQEPLALAAAADVYVHPRAFQVEQQLLLYEAAGVLLGSKLQQLSAAPAAAVGGAEGQSASAKAAQERVLLLHALLSKATAAFTSDIDCGSSTLPATAAAVAVYWSRCMNALASLSKGFQPFRGASVAGDEGSPSTQTSVTEAPAVVAARDAWLQTLALFTTALLAAGAEGSVLEVEGTSLLVLPPIFPACIFLLRRLLSLLGPLAASSTGALLPLLYDAVLVDAESPAAAAAAASCLQQQQHSPEAAAQQLSGFCMQIFVSLKGPELTVLVLQHLPMILERHLGLYLKAVAAVTQEPNSADLQRECRELQEQLVSLVATAARETPEALLNFAAASLLSADNCRNASENKASLFLGALHECFVTAGVNNGGSNCNRPSTTQHALLRLLHQQHQQLHMLLFGTLRPTRGVSAITSRAPHGSPASQEIASETWRCILLILLQACCPGACPVVAAASSQAWAQIAGAFLCKPDRLTDVALDQERQNQLPSDLQQVQEAMRDFIKQNVAMETQLRQRRPQMGSSQSVQQSEEMQSLRQQQQQRVRSIEVQQAGQQLSLLLPLSSLFSATADLFVSLSTQDPQHIKVAADIGGLWRTLGYGIPPGTPQRTASAAAAAAGAAAGAQLGAFFIPLRSGIQDSLARALAPLISNPGGSAAALLEALGQTEGQQLRAVIRAWQQRIIPK